MKTQSVARISLRSAERASLSLDAESEFEYGFRHETLYLGMNVASWNCSLLTSHSSVRVMPVHAGIQKPLIFRDSGSRSLLPVN
jgi:hypothetical protein